MVYFKKRWWGDAQLCNTLSVTRLNGKCSVFLEPDSKSWQRSCNTRQVKLADGEILRNLAGAMCDLPDEAA